MSSERVYLPGTIRDRIQDLMKARKVTQTELATRIGSTESALSRFISGKTDKLGDESVIRIARTFQVSTDFLLGVTSVPDRKNYEITELGLSAQAARNLYTGKVNAAIVNCLLESPRFAEVTYVMEQYLNDTIASGYAAQNELYATVSSLLRRTGTTKAAELAAQDVKRRRTPPYQADLTTIQNQFMAAVREVKKEVGSDFAAAQQLTKETTERMFQELTKGQDAEHSQIMPEELSSAITGQLSGMAGVNPDALNKLGQALTEFMQAAIDQPASTEQEYEGSE